MRARAHMSASNRDGVTVKVLGHTMAETGSGANKFRYPVLTLLAVLSGVPVITALGVSLAAPWLRPALAVDTKFRCTSSARMAHMR